MWLNYMINTPYTSDENVFSLGELPLERGVLWVKRVYLDEQCSVSSSQNRSLYS